MTRQAVSIPSRRVGDPAGVEVPFPDLQVSIPSRRVGDQFASCVFTTHAAFPSPQGGSETPTAKLRIWIRAIIVSIPSRRVGDNQRLLGLLDLLEVSIPSRRVGEKPTFRHSPSLSWFPSPQGGSETNRGGASL
jgi:hypothetical protein